MHSRIDKIPLNYFEMKTKRQNDKTLILIAVRFVAERKRFKADKIFYFF